MPVISLCGAKGGSLKTASSLSLGTLFAMSGRAVAVVDLDPQHSATRALPRPRVDGSTEEVAYSGVVDPLSADPVPVEFHEAEADVSLMLLRGGRGLVTATRNQIHRQIDRVSADLVILDTLPAVGDIVIGAMERSDLIVIPVEATADAILALPGVIETAELVARPSSVIRLLLTRVDARERITVDARLFLEDAYPGCLYRTAIPADARAKECGSYRRPVVLHDPSCRAARAYRDLLKEVDADLFAMEQEVCDVA
jgi:chromosome partitioning protein